MMGASLFVVKGATKSISTSSQPSRHEFIIKFINALIVSQQLLGQKNGGRFLHTAGRRQVMTFQERRPSNLTCLPFLADSDEEVTLLSCELEKHILIGFLILMDDLSLSLINVSK